MASSATFTARQAANRLGVSIGSITRWIQSGKLQAFKDGDKWWIRESDLDRFIASDGPEAPDDDEY
tara:strand:- start:86 stop:283 length:198 start_codon:yes stop_codon:yes gene_type:complete